MSICHPLQRLRAMPGSAPATGATELIPTIRELVLRQVEATSLRNVANQIGMSPSGLSKFMNGAAPYQKTVGKLESWYLRARTGSSEAPLDAGTVAMALRTLARVVSPSRRNGFVAEVMDRLQAASQPGEPLLVQLREYDQYISAG